MPLMLLSQLIEYLEVLFDKHGELWVDWESGGEMQTEHVSIEVREDGTPIALRIEESK